MRDPLSTRGAPLHTGLISNLGVLIWFAAAVMCLFAAAVLRRARPGTALFLFASGLLTLLLALDDFLMLHEFVGWALGIPEPVILAGYGLLTLGWLTRFRAEIGATDYMLLAVALALFAVSLVPDVPVIRGLSSSDRFMRLLEDGSKLLGIVTWTTYFARTCARAIAVRAPASPLDGTLAH